MSEHQPNDPKCTMKPVFEKPFTQQEAISEAVIERIGDILRSGRLHRYNVVEGEEAEATLLEREYAAWQGTKYCLACTSGGYALQLAMRATGLQQGDAVLANAYTLAPVPGAIHAAGGQPVFVEINDDWRINTDDLAAKAESSGAKFLMLSHMRGHIADMETISAICQKHSITMIEDCAHTMGATWNGIRSGNFGTVAAFSTQTYKHINSGEGGLFTTDDPYVAARAIVMSGSYMLYGSHGAAPNTEIFDEIKLVSPNMSGRMDNMRAALIRGQLAGLDENVSRWNSRYQALERTVATSPKIFTAKRPQQEHYVGSSFQFRPKLAPDLFPTLLENCGKRGVDIKWFGAAEPKAFTSRYDSWKYLGEQPRLPKTLDVLSTTCDIRVPLTFNEDDCTLIGEIIVDEVKALYT